MFRHPGEPIAPGDGQIVFSIYKYTPPQDFVKSVNTPSGFAFHPFNKGE